MHREPDTAGSSVAEEVVGLLGGTSFLGAAVIARWLGLASGREGGRLVAFSRSSRPAGVPVAAGVAWHTLTDDPRDPAGSIPSWVTVCPVWGLAAHFPRFEAAGIERLVAVSSTSRFTKRDAATAADRSLAARLAAAEERVLDWADRRGVTATILRPTMVYDGIHDRNVAAIASVVRRFGCLPVAGAASGLRQPVHVEDVAAACLAALGRNRPLDAYELSGGETLSYREMIERIFTWVGRETRLIRVPLTLVRAALPLAGLVPPVGRLASMADRMNQDLVFDHRAAARDLGFEPRRFTLPPTPQSEPLPAAAAADRQGCEACCGHRP